MPALWPRCISVASASLSGAQRRTLLQFFGQRRLRGVEDVVPFCYGTVAWFLGKKVRAGVRCVTSTAVHALTLAQNAEHRWTGRALAPLECLPARPQQRGPHARHLAGARPPAEHAGSTHASLTSLAFFHALR
jgi:hypothetical protein